MIVSFADAGTEDVFQGRDTRAARRAFSIRVNDQFRVCFGWTKAGPTEVEIADYH